MDKVNRLTAAALARPSGPAKPLRFHRQLALLVFAVVSLLSTWYFAVSIAPRGGAPSGLGSTPDLYPAWYATRTVLLQHQSPYTPNASSQIRIGVYGSDLGKGYDEQRFAYPLYSTLLFAPLAAVTFDVANKVAWFAFLILTVCSVRWWAPAHLAKMTLACVTLLLLATHATVHALQVRQPTLLIAALLAGAFACFSSKSFVSAGILAALATSKPQLAVAVLLPIIVWAVRDWRTRKSFLIAFCAAECVLLGVSEVLVPGWFSQWVATLRAYAGYARAEPLVAYLFGDRLAIFAAAILVCAVIWVAVRWPESDLLFAVSFSIAAFQLLFPFQLYNEVLLIPPMFWILSNGKRIRSGGQIQLLLSYCVWILLGASWVSSLILCIFELIFRGSALAAWTFPLVSLFFLPLAVFGLLAVCAITSSVASLQPADFEVPYDR
jgi:hypothetical protein